MKFVKVAVRFFFVLGLCLTMLAIGVARLVPKPASAHGDPVRPARIQYQGVNDQAALGPERGCRLLDPDTGRIVTMTLPDNDAILFARSSPWEGPDGQVQVVGRWLSRNDNGSAGGIRQVGVARCTFPDGKILDRIAVDIVPLSAPCWFPDRTPRVLYGGTDGQLYQLAFDDRASDEDDEPDRDIQPQLVRWACKTPGEGEVRIGDPIWPTDPTFGGRVFVSLSYLDRDSSAFVPAQIWWLTRSDDRGAIVEAGRLTVHPRHAPTLYERLPSLAETPDHGLALAYLSRSAGQYGWDLRLAPVSIDPTTGHPRTRVRAGALVARDVAVAA